MRRQRPAERGPGWALEERLLDARPLAPQGTTPAVTHVTRFTPKGTFQAETWQGVRLGEAWAGIEVELAARGRNFEKLFHVAPGADPERIRVGLRGAEGVHVAADGRLIVATGNGEIAYTAPLAWQEIGGERQPVAVRYALLAPEEGAPESAYGFSLGAYDRRHPLTIDPLIQSTYLGGSASDFVYALALAADGDVLVGGHALSTDLPGTAGGAQANHGGGSEDGFVARLAGDLTTLDDPAREKYPGRMFGDEFPLAWRRKFEGARTWYTALGHKPEHYSDPKLTQHILGGILWAMGQSPRAARHP